MTSPARFCEHCGAALAAEARFCESCGRLVSAPTTPVVATTPSDTKAQTHLSPWLIIGGIAMVAIIVCVGIVAVGGIFFFQTTTPATPTAVAFVSTSIPILPINPTTPAPMPVIATATPAAKPTSPDIPISPSVPPTSIATLTLPINPTALPPTPVVATTTPVAKPTLPSAKPTYSAVTFSSAFDQSALAPINPGKMFPYGANIVYAYWTYSGVVPKTPFEYAWLKNGVRLDSSGESFINASGKSFQWILHPDSPYTPKIPLDPGTYQFIVRVSGQVILSDAFTIQMPASTIIVFFTIKNNAPTGFVIDKQGVKHTPPGYLTISDFHVAPGDRITIQTDQPRFSLLFDCSTFPQTYSPCDFAADSAGQLPAEIRKNKSGSAYLNISRADNWAGTRPNFPSQRYPADPVLRIVLGD